MFARTLPEMKKLYLFTRLAYELGAIGYIEHMEVLRELHDRANQIDIDQMAKWVTEGLLPIKLADQEDIRDMWRALKESRNKRKKGLD